MNKRTFLLLATLWVLLLAPARSLSANATTQQLQALLDTGEAVDIPAGLYEIDEALNVYSVGQSILGKGQNRTIIRQLTAGADVFRLRRHETSTTASHHWQGLYSGGGGCFLIEIGRMTIEGVHGDGRAIVADDGPTWNGDFLHFHDLTTFRFATHILTNGIAHLRLERIVASNATAQQELWGTGIKCVGATPHSHVMQAITLSGLDICADIICRGLQGNFGDIGLCNVGLRITGTASITGGQFERCARCIEIGADGPSHVDLRALHFQVEEANTLHPIRVSNGSTLTGSAVRGAASKELVECAGWYDHAFLDNHPAGNDWSGNDYYFVNTAMGIRARFSHIKGVKQIDHLPTASADTHGAQVRIFNGDAEGNERVVRCSKVSGGGYEWIDQ